MRWLILVLIALNFSGFLFGMISYWSQLSSESFVKWFLIADCPIASLLFMIILFLILGKKKVPGILADFVFIYLIKNALTTFLIFLLYPDSFLIPFPVITVMAHLFLMFQSFLLMHFFSRSSNALLMLVLLDFSDFFLGTLYNLPSREHVIIIFYFAFLIDFLLFFLKEKLAKLINH